MNGFMAVSQHEIQHMDICNSVICNCSILEATQMSFIVNGWINHGTHSLFSAKKKGTIKPWKDMEET